MNFFSDNLSLTKMAVFPAILTEKRFGTPFELTSTPHRSDRRSLKNILITNNENN